MKIRTLVLTSVVLFLGACATAPDIIPVEPETVSEPIPAPVVEDRSPTVVDTLPYVEPAPQFAAPVPGSLEDFIYQTGEDRVYFGYDRYDLDAASREALRQQADWLNLYKDVSAVIAGNADERGTRDYNLALGARRADSVKEYLVSLGVNPSRLITLSFGKERPLDARSNAEGWARNRNAHTNLTSGLSSSSVF